MKIEGPRLDPLTSIVLGVIIRIKKRSTNCSLTLLFTNLAKLKEIKKEDKTYNSQKIISITRYY